MKKIIAILSSILLVCVIAFPVSLAEEAAQSGPTSDMLIVYFSRVGVTDFEEDVDAVTSATINLGENGEFLGNCEIAASYIAEATGGDLFQIITEQRYPSDYRDTTDVAADEQDENARPALTSHVENMDAYNTVFLVYPNWWGALPMAVNTFLEEYDFSGKTIVPLCTHEGSGLGGTPREIAALCPDATLLDGLAIRGGRVAGAQEDVIEWLRELGHIQ